MDVLWVDGMTTYSYSPGREAVGEWFHAPGRPTIFAGWMWDGKVRSREHAVELLNRYLEVWGCATAS